MSRADQQAAIERILASETFRRPAKLREFLRYVAGRALSNDHDALTEQQIGIAVFGRRPGYNPGDDSVVRVQAHHLREKLSLYYAAEGGGDPVLVAIPKGRYVPVFEIRAKSQPAAPLPTPAAPKPARTRRWRLPLLLCALAFGSGVAFHSALTSWRKLPAPSAHTAGRGMNPLLAAVLQPGRETLLVMEDMGLYVAYALRGKDGVFPLDDYRQNRHLPDVPSLFRDEVIGRRLAGRLSSARYVAYANADFGYKLARAYPEASRSLSVRFPRDIHLRDLKASNLILLGGTVVNPWVGLYEDGLNFAMRYFEPGGGFANRLPLGAEPGVFGGWSASERLYFARIALIPNLQEGSRVLILTGMGTAVTETAADFVLDPGAGNRLPAEVVQALAQPGNHVEILLKCAPVLDAPYRSEVAAWRVKRQ